MKKEIYNFLGLIHCQCGQDMAFKGIERGEHIELVYECKKCKDILKIELPNKLGA